MYNFISLDICNIVKPSHINIIHMIRIINLCVIPKCFLMLPHPPSGLMLLPPLVPEPLLIIFCLLQILESYSIYSAVQSLSRSILILRLTCHCVSKTLFVFIEYYSVYGNATVLSYSGTDVQLDYFQLLAIEDKSTMNTGIKIFVGI